MSDILEKNIPLIANLNLPLASVGGFSVGNVTSPVGNISISSIGSVGGSGASGSSGQVLTSNGLNGTNWSIPQSNVSIQPSITKITTPLEVNGRDILKELDEMRDALLLLKRDVNMEEKYPKLKELKDAYERALEKYKTFDAIKDSK